MTNERATKAVAYGSVLLGLVMVAIMIGVWWLTVFHQNPAIEIVQPVQTDAAVYQPGELVGVTFDFCKHTSAPGTLAQAFLSVPDGWAYILPSFSLPYVPPGCHVRELNIRVPLDLPPGRYRWHATIVYRVNILAERTADFYTNEFEVTR